MTSGSEDRIRNARVFVDGLFAGRLVELTASEYSFSYSLGYQGPPVSLTLLVRLEGYFWDRFPPFFDGLLPEGTQLDALLRQNKIDRRDGFSQLLAVGGDLVGYVTVEAEVSDG